MKVCTIVGTRPEIIRLSRVIATFDEMFDHTLVHTGQNYDYELNDIFFKDLDLNEPQFYLNCAGPSAAQTIANVISKTDTILDKIKPDSVLILGDTNSCLAALSAKKKKIPIFHMEAGNRSFDQRVPEEINRKIVDHISDINLPYSTLSRNNLLSEGIPTDQIIKTGSPMFEVIEYYKGKIEQSSICEQIGVSPKEYFLISAHREENIDDDENFNKLVNLVSNLNTHFGCKVVVSLHPRTRNRLEKIDYSFNRDIMFMKPFGFTDYLKLQCSARVVLSDSGTITEEASILGFKALNIRHTHERPEGMEESAVMMVGLDWERILKAMYILDRLETSGKHRSEIVSDYHVGNVSSKIAQLIVSYTSYIKSKIWRSST